MFQERKASFKAPPASVREAAASQATRRTRALEEQKRRRAERIDSTRQLDILADLSLGASDDEADDDNAGVGASDSIIREGISQFATMLPPTAGGANGSEAMADTPIATSSSAPGESAQPTGQDEIMQTHERKRGKNKRKGKGRASAQNRDDPDAKAQRSGKQQKAGKNSKPSKWADKCMYAELLEMKEGFTLSGDMHDGIPDDLETGWVALTPIPVGKRCLAVTHQTSGIAGIVPNTTLRSRVLGKALIKPFPSTLPSQTVLDCILDDNWRDNGILHVLDVMSWKGQDIADCETPFRFWWRDTRLSELSSFPPPPNAAAADAQSSGTYQFPHPTTFCPVPFDIDTTIPHLLSSLVPLTRATRSISISIPVPMSGSSDEGAMDLDNAATPLVQLQTKQVHVQSDGMLLYVAQASYEPGTSPLSNWVPLRAYQTREEMENGASPAESPLNVFERLLQRRVAGLQSVPEVNMEQ